VTTGYSLVELIFVMGLVVTLSAVAVPQTLAALDDSRTYGAARYLAGRLQRARMEAVMRSSDVGVRFTPGADGRYAYAVYVDGNFNGVRSADIRSGVDRQLMPPEKLADMFAHVDFGALPNLPAVDAGGTPPGDDPIRLGASSIATFTAKGTSSTGRVYIRGERAQYVVRVFGDTGKTRVMKFEASTRQWRPL
jgi:type II secretory pathway pseudopilin PulG